MAHTHMPTFAESAVELADCSPESADSTSDSPVGMTSLADSLKSWPTLCIVGRLSLFNMLNI